MTLWRKFFRWNNAKISDDDGEVLVEVKTSVGRLDTVSKSR
jgi:hypothetical protein